VDTQLLEPQEGKKLIPTIALEDALIEGVGRGLSFMKELLGIDPPVFLLVSMLRVKGYRLAVAPRFRSFTGQGSVDRDALILPEEFIEDVAGDPTQLLRPVFDAIWNAAGWISCLDYDGKGRFTRGR
jgi:hypothetical protein